MILFSLPFAAVGVGMAVWLAVSIQACLQMRKWIEVPAKIVKVELIEHSDDDGTTHETTAQYDYVYDDAKHRGTRVGPDGGADNIGSFQQTAYQELKECQQREKPFRCFVNPEHPEESILYRDLRWEMVFFKMVFVAAFGGGGFGLLIGGIFACRGQLDDAFQSKIPRETPWQARADWAHGEVVCSEKTKAVRAAIVALAWNLAAFPTWMAVGGLLPWPGGALNWAVGALPAIGLLLAASGIARVRRWRRYGDSVFRMASVPGVIGGQLAGQIRIGAPARSGDTFRLVLSCIRQTKTGSGEDAGTSEETDWRSERAAAAEMAEESPDQAVVPVLFDIPRECLPTRGTSLTDRTFWRLEIASRTGGRYRARFEVPVFKTPESDPALVAGDRPAAALADGSDPQCDLHAAGVLCGVTPDGDGLRFFFPAGRNRGLAAFLTFFSAVWTVATLATCHFGAPIFLVGCFALFDLIPLSVMLDLWLYQSTIDISPTRIAVQEGWLGIERRREISIGDVIKIETVKSASYNAQVFYNLVLVCAGNKRILLGKRVPGHRTAQGVIRAIEEALGRTYREPK